MLRIGLAVLHLAGFGVALGSVHARARAAARLGPDPGALRRCFAADNWWGVAALALLTSGLWRAFAGTEKAPSYYWGNSLFWAKMGALGVLFALEVWPMVTLIRWRIADARGAPGDAALLAAAGRRIAAISDLQTALLLGILVAATLVARGYGAG